MTHTKDEALDLALEALEYFSDTSPTMAGKAHAEDAITAIKQARAAQPAPTVQEPVAYWIPKAEQFCIADPSGRPFAKAWEPLYTTPPAQPAVPEGWKLVKMQPHELAEQLYLEHPTYRGTKPLQWRDAPNEARREWLDKANAMLAAAPEKGGAA
jgi:uncharacterized protein YbdZ (MbtH family)